MEGFPETVDKSQQKGVQLAGSSFNRSVPIVHQLRTWGFASDSRELENKLKDTASDFKEKKIVITDYMREWAKLDKKSRHLLAEYRAIVYERYAAAIQSNLDSDALAPGDRTKLESLLANFKRAATLARAVSGVTLNNVF